MTFTEPYQAAPPYVKPSERHAHPSYEIKNPDKFNVRYVTLKRKVGSETLGFNICGGSAAEYGVFITSVEPYSAADNQHLKVGDQILKVNDNSFLHIMHDDAVRILKAGMQLDLMVRYFPYNYKRQQSLLRNPYDQQMH